MTLKDINRSHIASDGYYGNPKEFFGFAVVGFVDLLGFSSSVDRKWSDAEDSPLARLLRIKEATKSIPDLKAIRYIVGDDNPPVIDACRVHTVSDSIVVCAALPPEGKLVDLLAAAGAVSHSMQAAWSAAVAEGFSARGAMELGKIYWNEHETVGPAFNWVYQLESEIAKTSRLIVGPDFLSKLLEILERDAALDKWSDWPSAHLFSVSGGRFNADLIELTPYHLWQSSRNGSNALEPIAAAAGSNAWRYEQTLKRLQADAPSPAATIDQLRRGQRSIVELLKSKRTKNRYFNWVCRLGNSK